MFFWLCAVALRYSVGLSTERTGVRYATLPRPPHIGPVIPVGQRKNNIRAIIVISDVTIGIVSVTSVKLRLSNHAYILHYKGGLHLTEHILVSLKQLCNLLFSQRQMFGKEMRRKIQGMSDICGHVCQLDGSCC